MDDLLILLALAIWIGLWAARELDWCGITRGQVSVAARQGRQRPASGAVPEGGADGPYLDAVGPRP